MSMFTASTANYHLKRSDACVVCRLLQIVPVNDSCGKSASKPDSGERDGTRKQGLQKAVASLCSLHSLSWQRELYLQCDLTERLKGATNHIWYNLNGGGTHRSRDKRWNIWQWRARCNTKGGKDDICIYFEMRSKTNSTSTSCRKKLARNSGCERYETFCRQTFCLHWLKPHSSRQRRSSIRVKCILHVEDSVFWKIFTDSSVILTDGWIINVTDFRCFLPGRSCNCSLKTPGEFQSLEKLPVVCNFFLPMPLWSSFSLRSGEAVLSLTYPLESDGQKWRRKGSCFYQLWNGHRNVTDTSRTDKVTLVALSKQVWSHLCAKSVFCINDKKRY